MNQNDQAWLENRVHAAVDDDFYLDRDEEKRIKEEAAAKGIAVKDTDLIIRSVIDKFGAVCERVLIDELDRLLHQFTDNDKRLDGKEERDALDKVLGVASGKKKGLDPRVAADYANSFCRINGVRRDSDTKRWAIPVAAFAIVAVIALVALWIMANKKSPIESNSKTITQSDSKVVAQFGNSSVVILSDKDKAEIDDQLRRASQFVEKAQYTDPPEKSAKACLDTIHQIDPKGDYRGQEVRAITSKIVEHYLTLADNAYISKDMTSVIKWIERAKLMGASSEVIREKERALGIVKGDK